MNDLLEVINLVVPDVVAGVLVSVCESTGLRWGPTPRAKYWFQPPKLHIVLFLVVVLLFCGSLYRASRGFKSYAIATLGTSDVGRSLRCPLNRAIGSVLLACFASQVYTKAIRPKPLVQLGWLLMPCHLMTLAWAHVLLSEKVSNYGRACYVGTLLIDWYWAPLLAIATPDWSDHQFAWEGHIFIVHHTLLGLLPFYFAARYNTLPLNRRHLYHLTWVSTFICFAIYTPYSLLSGLNLNYMLYPPAAMQKMAVLGSVFYRPLFVPVLMLVSSMNNVVIRAAGKGIQRLYKKGKQVERKVL